MEQLKEELREAQEVVREEQQNLASYQSIVNAAVQSNQEAQAELKLLTSALQVAQAAAQNADAANSGCQNDMAQKEALLDAARARDEQINTEMKAAKADLDNTKTSCGKASQAAKQAKESAAQDTSSSQTKKRKRKKKR